MASHGAMKDPPPAAVEAKQPKKELREISLRKSANGGVIAEHHHNVYDGMNKPHTFSAGEGHKLAAHIEQHFGLKMPGKSGTDSAEQTKGDD